MEQIDAISSTTEELRSQWGNPSDILSLLLLIGGDIVQKSIAELVGYNIRVPGDISPSLPIVPIAFSFGWTAYAFPNLLAAIGDMRLMPVNDSPSVPVNCSNAFSRENRSWVLGRLLRDHEIRYELDARRKEEGGRAESLRVDISTLAQFRILAVTLYGGLDGSQSCYKLELLSHLGFYMWIQEKWTGRRLERNKITCLTRGNGHLHIMVFIGTRGSWDLESLATGLSVTRSGTRWVSVVLAILWTCLLISIASLTEHTWFLVGIEVIGMLQKIFAAGTLRAPSASNFHITEFSRAPTIIGRRESYNDDIDTRVNLKEDIESLAGISTWVSEKPKSPTPQSATSLTEYIQMLRWLSIMSKEDGVPLWLEAVKQNQGEKTVTKLLTVLNPLPGILGRLAVSNSKENNIISAVGVHGALIELEKWVPSAGLAMAQIFFSAGLKYNEETVRDDIP